MTRRGGYFHFAPERGLFGDPKPFYWQGEYHVFFQNSPAGLSFDGMQWGHAVSRDLLRWRSLPPALVPEAGSPDAFGCWTGCVLEHSGTFHIFYTGCAGPGGRTQTVCHATSDDLVHWVKDPSNPLVVPAAPYATGELVAWRDPQVVKERDGSFTMLLAAEMPGFPRSLCGCVARLTSQDLVGWQPQAPLHFPKASPKCECPDLFEHDGRHVLLYSDYGPQVRLAADPLGPFRMAGIARLDDLRYYAPKTAADERGRRIAFGFISSRTEPDDESRWEWGGVMALPREIEVGGGSVLMKPAREAEGLRRDAIGCEPETALLRVGCWASRGSSLTAEPETASDELALILLGAHPPQVEVRTAIRSEAAEGVGVLLGCDRHLAAGYLVEVSRARRRLSLSRIAPSHNSADPLLQSVPLPPDLGRELDLQLLLDRDVLEVFVDRRVCLSARLYGVGEESHWGLYVRMGAAEFVDLRAWRLDL